MVTSEEVFSSYLEDIPPMHKTMTTVPNAITHWALAAVVGATAAAGYVLTPSSKFVVNAMGGALGGALGMPMRERLLVERKKAFIPVVATLLSGGLADVTSDALNKIAKDFGIEKDEFAKQAAHLYFAYLDACFASSVVDTVELSEMLRLQQVLDLSAAQVGNQIYAAALKLYRRHRGLLEMKNKDSILQLQKFVFLAERALSGDESEEGYRYETMRLQKLFRISHLQWKAMAETVAAPFYMKAVRAAVIDSSQVTSEQLREVRLSLGIMDEMSATMHTEALGLAAAGLLQPELGDDAKLTDADEERLASVPSSALRPPPYMLSLSPLCPVLSIPAPP